MHQQHTAFENNVGKEEIACTEQFLIFPQCFWLNQKTVSQFINIFDIISLFAAELEEPKIDKWGLNSKDKKINVNKKVNFVVEMVENIVRKGENAGDQHFLLFPQCFQKAYFTSFIYTV